MKNVKMATQYIVIIILLLFLFFSL